MVNTFFVVYPKQVNTYNRAAPKTVIFFIDPSYHGVAATSGNVVRFDPSYFAKNPKDIDVVTHETMHIVQAYKGRVPVWAVEGIADYVRYTMGFDNKGAGWSLPAFKPSQHYTNGYAVTARFFVWLEKKVKPGLVKAYDKALRDGKHADFFKRFTGKTVGQLWKMYAKNPKI
ncbi:hypothetical protein AAVH_27599 [Aphelenchoides avenae]|nr:hypothetical protein AAVH_27599 [Aphelenchus avenae]